MSDEHEHVEGCCDAPWSDAQVAEMQAATQAIMAEVAARNIARAVGGLPIVGAIRPTVLAGTFNGRLPTSLLLPIDARGGKGLPDMGRCWRAMRARMADATGIDLWYTGVYRSYDQQVALLKSRAEPVNPGIGNYKWVRHWNGQTWYGNGAQVATPGTSNHGWGMAVDMAIRSPGSSVPQPISQAALTWLIPHADEYGFSWEAQSEPWHVRMVTGDDIPLAVLAYEQSGPNPPKPPPPKPKDTDMPIIVKDARGNVAQLEAGYLIHLNDGDFVTLFTAAGGEVKTITNAQYDSMRVVEDHAYFARPVTPPTDLTGVAKSAELAPLARSTEIVGISNQVGDVQASVDAIGTLSGTVSVAGELTIGPSPS